MIYTGIGSRSTPQPILELMRLIACCMGERGHTLRSGGARGADTAFEEGCDLADGSKEIFVPVSSGSSYGISHRLKDRRGQFTNVLLEGVVESARICAVALLGKAHWENLTPYGRLAHARNVMQVLGIHLDTPSKAVICWTPGGSEYGGTRTALRMANEHGIPIYNLYYPDIAEAYRAKCRQHIENKNP